MQIINSWDELADVDLAKAWGLLYPDAGDVIEGFETLPDDWQDVGYTTDDRGFITSITPAAALRAWQAAAADRDREATPWPIPEPRPLSPERPRIVRPLHESAVTPDRPTTV